MIEVHSIACSDVDKRLRLRRARAIILLFATSACPSIPLLICTFFCVRIATTIPIIRTTVRIGALSPPSDACRLNAKFLAKPHCRLLGVRGIAVALHGVDRRQPALLTVIADAVTVIRKVLLQVAPQVF